jgi:hypothetical protein
VRGASTIGCFHLGAMLLLSSLVVGGEATSGSAACGLAQAAFCETFESGPAALDDRGRGHELSRTRFSVTRYEPSLSTGNGQAFWVWEAELGQMQGEPEVCRADVPALLLPTIDTWICEPNSTIGSRYLLSAVGAQNYGSNAIRIRQPFDFAARTGRIRFDADVYNNFLLGYHSVVISADPSPTPSWDINGRGPNPREGVMIILAGAGIDVHQVRDYAMTVLPGDPGTLPGARGRLARVEIRLSQQQVEILTSEPSTDGIHFGPLVSRRSVVFPQPLGFSRGYVSLLGHNHATWKYAMDFGDLPRPIRSWNTYWDNIAFDGPRIDTTREYEIPDAAVPGTETTTDEFPPGTQTTVVHSGLSLGYVIPNDSEEMSAPLTFRNVSLAHATRARLVFNGYYQGYNEDGIRLGTGRLHYRLNDGPLHVRAFTPGEVAMLDEPGQTGGYNHSIDLPLAELREGDNSVRFATAHIESGYPNAVVNLDLLIDFDLQRVFFDSFE